MANRKKFRIIEGGRRSKPPRRDQLTDDELGQHHRNRDAEVTAKPARSYADRGRPSGQVRRARKPKRRWPRLFVWPVFSTWALIPAMLAILVAISIYQHPRWSAFDHIRHIIAAPNCAMAKSVGLGSARKGAPGYYNSHDRDDDGKSCEPFPVGR